MSQKINADKYFHWNPTYSHVFEYTFAAEERSTITVTYDQGGFFNITAGQEIIGSASQALQMDISRPWFVNSSLLPPPTNVTTVSRRKKRIFKHSCWK